MSKRQKPTSKPKGSKSSAPNKRFPLPIPLRRSIAVPLLGSAASAQPDMKTDVKSSAGSLSTGSSSSIPISLIDPSAVYRVRMTDAYQFGTDSGGTLAKAITLDPTTSPDFGGITALFSEIRVISSVLHLSGVSVYNSSTTAARFLLPVALDLDNVNSNPASTQDVWSIAGAKVVNLNSPEIHTIRAKIPQMGWADMAVPAPGPYAGCWGAWVMYRANMDLSKPYVDAFIESVYEVRGRR